jgi:hypothetical protein
MKMNMNVCLRYDPTIFIFIFTFLFSRLLAFWEEVNGWSLNVALWISIQGNGFLDVLVSISLSLAFYRKSDGCFSGQHE